VLVAAIVRVRPSRSWHSFSWCSALSYCSLATFHRVESWLSCMPLEAPMCPCSVLGRRCTLPYNLLRISMLLTQQEGMTHQQSKHVRDHAALA
jgi:hypothetical protein